MEKVKDFFNRLTSNYKTYVKQYMATNIVIIIATLVFTFVVVVLSTAVGLAMACFLNRKFVGKKLVNSLIILSYVIPSVCLIFAWRYMLRRKVQEFIRTL